MQKIDIRIFKNNLREKSKQYRRSLTPEEKEKKDLAIFNKLTALQGYQRAKMLICYVSTAIEVDTRRLINHALSEGKTVVAPRCIDGTRYMDFYQIASFDDLEPGTFGVLEPKTESCRKVTNFSDSICVVPALCFDFDGYRLGYGKGYYDRFLSNYHGCKVGICYAQCVEHRLPRGRFDIPVEMIITEKYIRKTSR